MPDRAHLCPDELPIQVIGIASRALCDLGREEGGLAQQAHDQEILPPGMANWR